MIKGNIFFGFIAPFYIHFTPFCKHQQQATINRGISIKTRSAEQKSTFFLSSWYVAIIFFFIWSISLLCDGSVHRWFWIKNKCLPLFFLLSCIPKLTPNIVVNLFLAFPGFEVSFWHFCPSLSLQSIESFWSACYFGLCFKKIRQILSSWCRSEQNVFCWLRRRFGCRRIGRPWLAAHLVIAWQRRRWSDALSTRRFLSCVDTPLI